MGKIAPKDRDASKVQQQQRQQSTTSTSTKRKQNADPSTSGNPKPNKSRRKNPHISTPASTASSTPAPAPQPTGIFWASRRRLAANTSVTFWQSEHAALLQTYSGTLSAISTQMHIVSHGIETALAMEDVDESEQLIALVLHRLNQMKIACDERGPQVLLGVKERVSAAGLSLHMDGADTGEDIEEKGEKVEGGVPLDEQVFKLPELRVPRVEDGIVKIG
jgi:hypothetical protein